MKRTLLPLIIPILVTALFLTTTGCDDSTPEPEQGVVDTIPEPIDSSQSRLSARTTYLGGVVINMNIYTYVNTELSSLTQYTYTDGELSDSTLTLIEYEGDDIVKTRYGYEMGVLIPEFRNSHVYAGGHCVQIINETYENGAWVINSRREFAYDGDDCTQDQLSAQVDDVLTLVNIRNYSYMDGEAMLMESEGEVNGVFQQTGKYDFSYDGNYLTLIEDSLYDPGEEAYYMGGLTEYTEGIDGLLNRQGYSYDELSDQLEPFNATAYTYDAEGRLIESAFTVQVVDVPDSHAEYTYELGAGNYRAAFSEPLDNVYRRPLPQ